MYLAALLSLLAILQSAGAHGDHGEPAGLSNEEYAQRHMSTEHHIETFDTRSFFQLHDLNRDGVWDRDEIEAVYGVHHVYSQKKSASDEAHKAKADTIVETVLRNVDKNGDGKISSDELIAAGLGALPNFEGLGAEGHHYDVESEFFLHHEEIHHSTPETQTDESYNHPEDIEHFAMHEKIEAEEEARERRFQGIPSDAPLHPEAHDHPVPDTPQGSSLPPQPSPADHPHDDQKAFGIADPPLSPPPLIPNRETPPEKQPPEVKYGKAAAEGRKKDEWGQGEEGYKRPRTPADKMRKNLPYKSRSRMRRSKTDDQYKFRRNWGDF